MSKKVKKPSTEFSLEGFEKSLIDLEDKPKAIVFDKKEHTQIKFPLDAMPPLIQKVINNYHNANQLPIDFYGLTVLAIVGGVIGNSYVLKYKNRHVYSAVIYACIVGNSSIGKSPVLNLLLGPIFNIEKKLHKEYKERLELWEIENEGKKKKDFTNKPQRVNLLISDATTEAICKAHEGNLVGLISYFDELVAWLNSQNQYRNGSDTEFWLNAWSSTTIKVNRVTKDELFIPDPSITVLGGIQPRVLKSLVRKNNKANGFLYRILFAFPDDVKKPYETDNEISDWIESDYYRTINRIYDLCRGTSGMENSKVEIPISSSGKQIYREWKNAIADEINESNDDSISSLLGKIETYCLRIALVLHVLEKVSEQEVDTLKNTEVSQSTVENAIKLSDYFKANGLKVIDKIEIFNPFEDLSQSFIQLYSLLPNEFTTKEGINLAKKHNISESTFKRSLAKYTKLFKRKKHGVYLKLL